MSAERLPAPHTTRDYEALFIGTSDMEPAVPRGSIAFIEPPDFQGEGLYAIPFRGKCYGEVRRIYSFAGGWALQLDNWPEHRNKQIVSQDVLMSLGVRRVAGIVKPLTSGFSDFLRSAVPQTSWGDRR